MNTNDEHHAPSAEDVAVLAVEPRVPLATAAAIEEDDLEGGPEDAPPDPFPKFHPCKLPFPEGCWRITVRRTGVANPFVGTLRVDRKAPAAGPDGIIVSGDLYLAEVPVIGPVAAPVPDGDGRSVAAAASSAALEAPAGDLPFPFGPAIPIYRRDRYRSYLKVTKVSVPLFSSPFRPCRITLTAEQFDYTQPPVGGFQGSFPASASRTVTMRLTRKPWIGFPPSPAKPHYEGQWLENGAVAGSVSLTWASPFLRRATLEIDTLVDAVPPAPVPDPSGTGTEFFDTAFAKVGWQLSIVHDQKDIPVPTGVNAKDCWSSGNLHNLMGLVRNPATNLDAEWRMHLVVVPAKMGCSRGVMYDTIGVPREGCASFCDDGYPTSHSSNFGTAANKMQRNVPRAYLRSASHEVGHGFNQIHQENETSADNSLMTTTPSVADVLGGPTSGAPGVFPDQINIGFNATVRNHLAHMPDPVIRPGGWPFASWFGGGVPQASDRNPFDPSELAVTASVEGERFALGQPVDLTWTMINTGDQPLLAPSDVSIEGLFATVTVVDPRGRQRPVRPYAIVCDTVRLAELAPGASVSESARLFWSTAGFAFERPGAHKVHVVVSWSAGGLPVGAETAVDVWIDYPTSEAENADAALVMDPEVGQWVALGGGAPHLEGAVTRLNALAERSASLAADAGGESRVAGAFADLMPALPGRSGRSTTTRRTRRTR